MRFNAAAAAAIGLAVFGLLFFSREEICESFYSIIHV